MDKYVSKAAVSAAFAALIGFAGQASAVPVIDTSGGSFSGVTPFGEPNTSTYGQTFTVTGPETRLNSFSFRFNDALNPDFVDFAAYVYAWDGSKATGPQLYVSAGLTSSNNGGADGMETFVFNTGGIDLVSGQQYVAFVSSSNFFDGSDGTSSWELNDADVYAGGNFVFYNTGNDFNLLTTANWECANNCFGARDTYFVANFSTPAAVPLPGTLPLALLGLAGLVELRRRRG
jgi:hypothetical protein